MIALRIALLILCLDSDAFRERQEAFNHAIKTTKSAEVRQRCEKLLELQRPFILARLVGEAPPWLDALPFEHEGRWLILGTYLCREDVQRDSATQLGSYPVYRAATRAWVLDMLTQGKEEADIKKLLHIMQSRHPLWAKDAHEGWHGWSDDPNRPDKE